MLLVAVIWYLFITSILNVGQSYIEAYYGRGERQAGAGECQPLPERLWRRFIERCPDHEAPCPGTQCP